MSQAIFQRMSVRHFLDTPVEEDKIEQLLRAAMQAPSAGNQQPWEFWVIREPAVQKALVKTSRWTASCARAPLLFALACDSTRLKFPQDWQMDMSAATENLLLQAVDLGLGCVWMGVAPVPSRMAVVRETLGLEDKYWPFCLIACGYPKKTRNWRSYYKPTRVHFVGTGC